MLLKRGSVVVALPVALVPTAFYVSGSYLTTGIDGYWESASIRATSALLFIAPITGAASAWEIARLRRGGVLAYPSTRSRPRIVLRSLGPVLVGSVLCLAAGWALVGLDLSDGGGAPDYRVFLMGVALLAGWSAIGAIAGLLLPVVVAAPACLIVAYVALAYPPSMNPVWVRHLGGVNSSCCLDTDRIVTAAIVAPSVLAGGAVVAAATLFLVRSRVVASVLALGAIAAAVPVGVHLVRSLGPDPVGPRPASDLICAGEAVQVCVWPEHRSLLASAQEAATRIRQVVAAAIDIPVLASEERGAAWQFGLNQESSPAGTMESLVIGVLPQEPPATCRGGDWPSAAAVPLLQAWIEVRAGVSADVLSGLHSPALLAALADIRRQPPARQLALIHELHTAVRECTRAPIRLEPS